MEILKHATPAPLRTTYTLWDIRPKQSFSSRLCRRHTAGLH